MTNITDNPLERLEGKTTIDDGVVAKIAGLAARDVEGVYALGGGAARVVVPFATPSTAPTSHRGSASRSGTPRSPST